MEVREMIRKGRKDRRRLRQREESLHSYLKNNKQRCSGFAGCLMVPDACLALAAAKQDFIKVALPRAAVKTELSCADWAPLVFEWKTQPAMQVTQA